MTKILRKKAYYLRVRNTKGIFNLATHLTRRKQTLKNVKSTHIAISDTVYQLQHYREDVDIITKEKTVLLHIASAVIGKTALAIEMDCDKDYDDGAEQNAPTKHEFVDGEAYLLVKDQHVIFCSHGLTLKAVENYLNRLLHSEDVDERFEFTPIGNIDKLQLINRSGVKQVDFSATIFKMTQDELNENAEKMRKSRFSRILDGLTREVKKAFAKDLSEEEKKILEELQVDVSVKLMGNTRASLEARKFVKNEARTMLSDDLSPEVEFITGNGETIKSSDIQLHKMINIKKLNNSNSLEYEDAWLGLGNYFDELKQQKFTEL